MRNRIIAVTLAAVLCGALTASCRNGSTEDTSSAPSPVTLTIWHNDTQSNDPGSRQQRILQVANQYMELYPHVTIETVGNVGEEKMFTSMLAGSGPDLVKPNWVFGGQWGATGVLADLTDLVNRDDNFDKDDIISAAWDRCTYKNRIYTIPDEINSSEFYYNIDLLSRKGYDGPPRTYQELVEMAVDLTEYDSDGKIVRAGFIPDYPWMEKVLWPVAFGAKWIDPETNKITFDSPEMHAAYQWQLDIYNTIGYDKLLTFKTSLGSGTTNVAGSPFIDEKLVMQFSGEWLMDEIAQQRPNMNYGVTYCPYPDGKPELEGSMFITAHVWGINKRSDQTLEENWKFLSYLTSKDIMKQLSAGYNGDGILMARKSVLNNLPASVHPLKRKVAQMLQSDKCTGFPMSLYINDYLVEIDQQLTLVFSNKISLDDALENVTVKIQKFADENPIND
ncbi:ABC transporter substrate-binding protein [Fumia xinanensis]|uniref:Extracellular solute-binding protein n=1 Tax=Fumia xinanensis TaxID=2763659 RepID=A0A926E452_9FIRM|nr:extracellular solute-binding protein [Fumia xinanensis]MBC8560916.1 extracellular solute-binding protein [Fumia xinanensis]PWL43429.1 MAG: hypothetical protein DBY45_07280 [Clostridiales bacterium]